MTGFLTADAVAGLDHVFINIFVADIGLVVLDTYLVKRLEEAEVAHDRRNDLVVQELSSFLHVNAVHIDDVVAGDHVALFVNGKTAVSVAVIGKADVETVVNNELLQMLNVSGAAIGVEPTGYVFTGWYYNGKTYNPGDKYTLMAELDVLDTEGLDNVKDDTITIYPVFVKYEDLPVKTTHIYWYGNTVDNTGTEIEGVTSANEPKDETTHQDLQVNKAINIKKYTELPNVSTLYAGYEFKGWAKIEESAPNSTAVTPWLVWDKDTETYTVDGVAGVTQIAADEILSASGDYEKLLAVWEKEK